MKSNHLMFLNRAAMLLALAGVCSAPMIFGQDASAVLAPGEIGTPMFTYGTNNLAPEEVPPGATLPTWKYNFVFGGTHYSSTIVGTNPGLGAHSTTLPIVIVPLKFHFIATGVTLSPATALTKTLASPIFMAATLKAGGITLGHSQYEDLFEKAAFWNHGGSASGQHLLLSHTVQATVTINVPASVGTTVNTGGGIVGEVDINWFDNLVQTQLIPHSGVNPGQIPLFFSFNVFETSGGSCCILGYHSALNSGQTYSVAAYNNPGIFNVPIEDVHALSHELGELINDPFVNNATPAWGHVGQVSGCQGNLEVGDPLTGTPVDINLNGMTYHPQELVFPAWFSRQVPSAGVNHWYSLEGTFKTDAGPVCH